MNTEVPNDQPTSERIRPEKVMVNNIRTPVRDTGGDRDEAVVFVHGNPGSGADWDQLLPQVGRFARALAPDMPGFGRADKPGSFNYTVEGYAEHLETLLNKLGIKRAHLVLHDFGGPWGLVWAAMNPTKVASVTLVNIGILKGYRWHYLAKIWRAPLIGELMMATTSRVGFGILLKHGNPRGLPKSYLDEMYRNFDRGTKRAVLKLYRATSGLSDVAETLDQALRPLKLPALVIWGKRDPYIPHRYAEQQSETFPDAEIAYLEDSGHWPFIDNPARFNPIVINFLKKVTAPA